MCAKKRLINLTKNLQSATLLKNISPLCVELIDSVTVYRTGLLDGCVSSDMGKSEARLGRGRQEASVDASRLRKLTGLCQL
jgi:hypothetical protein